MRYCLCNLPIDFIRARHITPLKARTLSHTRYNHHFGCWIDRNFCSSSSTRCCYPGSKGRGSNSIHRLSPCCTSGIWGSCRWGYSHLIRECSIFCMLGRCRFISGFYSWGWPRGVSLVWGMSPRRGRSPLRRMCTFRSECCTLCSFGRLLCRCCCCPKSILSCIGDIFLFHIRMLLFHRRDSGQLEHILRLSIRRKVCILCILFRWYFVQHSWDLVVRLGVILCILRWRVQSCSCIQYKRHFRLR